MTSQRRIEQGAAASLISHPPLQATSLLDPRLKTCWMWLIQALVSMLSFKFSWVVPPKLNRTVACFCWFVSCFPATGFCLNDA